jgi:hypothetical protein
MEKERSALGAANETMRKPSVVVVLVFSGLMLVGLAFGAYLDSRSEDDGDDGWDSAIAHLRPADVLGGETYNNDLVVGGNEEQFANDEEEAGEETNPSPTVGEDTPTCEEEVECDDPAGCLVGIVVYDPADSTVLDMAILVLLFERPWLEETVMAMCPSSPPRCNMFYFDGGETENGSDTPDVACFEGEGVAGDDWSEVVVYYPGDAWPLEAAIFLLLEEDPGVLAEVSGLCPCSLD